MANFSERIGKSRKAYCSNCGGDRNCEIKGHHKVHDEDQNMEWWTNWYLLVCLGCDHVFAQSVASDSESHYPVGYDRDGKTIYELDERINYWPAKNKRERPEWFELLHANINHDRAIDLQSCLSEVYTALNQDLSMLPAVGIRTTFDVAAEILGVNTDKPFSVKLTTMVTDKLITTSQKMGLEVLINAGNASAHRGWKPEPEHLNALMDTLESFIHDAFIAPGKLAKAFNDIQTVNAKVPKKRSKNSTKESPSIL